MRRGCVACLVALLGACGPGAGDGGPEGDEAELPPPEAQPVSSAVDTVTGWTPGVITVQPPSTDVVVQRAARVGAHTGYDRVVFEFAGPSVPGYHIEYIDRPVRRCGSGQTTEIAGDGWLEVRLEPAAAHDPQGRPTVVERERSYGLPVVLELELTCDFEGTVTWVVGTASPNPYRVLEATDPPRLVVDLRR